MGAMKTARVVLLMLLAGGLLLASALPDRDEPLNLIRIPKGPAYSGRLVARLQIDVRQELATCLIAVAGRADLARLRRNGVRYAVLGTNVEGHEILIVKTADPGALTALRAAGLAVAVEPGTAVFWTEAGNAAESVPAGLPHKALAPRTVRPYVRPGSSACVGAPKAAAKDPLIETIVSLVSNPNLGSNVQTLQDFGTRYASTTNCEAAGESLFSSFSALGLDDVRFESFSFSSHTSRNVVAEKTGVTYPDDIYVISSHYDSTSTSPMSLAPGADDDASGAAAVLEAARVLAPYPLDFTVRFIAFSAEEWGLYGSRAYAAAAQGAGERIRGVINLDMIAYADALPEDLQIIVNPASEWLADAFLAAAANYGVLSATKKVDASFVYSDHGPFWDSGYAAMLAIEDEPLANPYYHTADDTRDKLEMDFFTGATRAALGLLAELAQPVRDGYPATPVGLSASTVVLSSLFNALKVVKLTWTAQTDAAGYNVYRTITPHLGYVKINATPLAGTSFTDASAAIDQAYYYAITAVGGTGLEGNRSSEVEVAATVAPTSSTAQSHALVILRGRR